MKKMTVIGDKYDYGRSELTALLAVDFENLRHMLGAVDHKRKSSWGYRNHFAPGGEDIKSMERLEAAGYVRRGEKYGRTNFFHATKLGCKAAGLNAKQTANALED